MENPDATVMSQFGNSNIILSLIRSFNTAVDPAPLIDAFYLHVWDILTANDYGLDVWGRIVGVQRVFQVAADKYWGYAEAGTISADPYGQSPFYNGAALTSNYRLSNETFRTLILAKAAANICDGSTAAINAILMAMFPHRGDAWVGDGLDMTMTYNFAFTPPLTSIEIAIISQSGVIPRPAGVSISVVQH
jgi:hypothetical protein